MNTRIVYLIDNNAIINKTVESSLHPLESNKVIFDEDKPYDIGFVKIGEEFYPPTTTPTDIANAQSALEESIAAELVEINSVINSAEFSSFSEEKKLAYNDYKAYLTGFIITNPILQGLKPLILPVGE